MTGDFLSLGTSVISPGRKIALDVLVISNVAHDVTKQGHAHGLSVTTYVFGLWCTRCILYGFT